MAINPNIILGLKTPEFTPPDQLGNYAKIMALQNNMQQGDLANVQLQQARQGLESDQRVRQLFATNPTATSADVMGIDPKRGLELRKSELEAKKTESGIKKDEASAGKDRYEVELKKLQHGGALLASAKDQSSWDAVKHVGTVTGVWSPQDVANFPQQFDPQFVTNMSNAAQTRNEQLIDQRARETAAETARHNTSTERETGRHNVSTEKNAAGQLGVAQGQLGVSRQRLAFDQAQPKGVVQQTNDGTFLIDPRNATAQPVLGPGGAQLAGKPAKDIPQSVLTGMMENNRSLNKVNQAIAAITGDAAGVPEGMIADKDATGFKGYLPNMVLNRVDPKGTDTRALVADIGSLKIHDRSGAAVTASESPRLMPFIPTANDNAETVAKKLNNFKREYELMQRETGDYYSADNGFKPYKPATMKTQGASPVKISGDDGYGALPKGAHYIGPDGVERVK